MKLITNKLITFLQEVVTSIVQKIGFNPPKELINLEET